MSHPFSLHISRVATAAIIKEWLEILFVFRGEAHFDPHRVDYLLARWESDWSDSLSPKLDEFIAGQTHSLDLSIAEHAFLLHIVRFATRFAEEAKSTKGRELRRDSNDFLDVLWRAWPEDATFFVTLPRRTVTTWIIPDLERQYRMVAAVGSSPYSDGDDDWLRRFAESLSQTNTWFEHHEGAFNDDYWTPYLFSLDDVGKLAGCLVASRQFSKDREGRERMDQALWFMKQCVHPSTAQVLDQMRMRLR